MTAVRYSVPGATSSAFVPVPALDGRGCGPYAAKWALTGQPGTQGVPTGLQEVAGTVNGQRVSSGFSDTRYMPAVWYPQLGYEAGLSEVPPVSVYSDNQMPVPAADPIGRAAVLARPPTFLGSTQVKEGRAIPVWSNWLPARSFGS